MPRTKLLISILCIITLSACHQHKADYDYLMTHPVELEKEAQHCHDQTSPDCAEVHRAVNDFFVLASQRHADPETFDKKILAAETDLTTAEQNVNQAGGQKNLEAATQKVNVLLAVVAATSTE